MTKLRHFKWFETFEDYKEYMENNPVLPNVSFVEDSVHYKKEEPSPEHDYSKDYFTIKCLSEGVITFTTTGEIPFEPEIKTIYYSRNNGESWETLTNIDSHIDVLEGDIIIFRGNNETYDEYSFYCDAMIEIEGNIMSLIYGDDFKDKTTFPEGSTNNFHYLFNGCNITTAENLILPVTTLTNGCYSYMFCDCYYMAKAPVLPADVLVQNSYYGMFNGCGSLNYIKCLATDISADYCLDVWVNNVSELGVFVKHPDMNDWGDNIPEGWTIEDANI